jgi:D-inositol-3-phosphate glycosyltransferase
VSLYHANPAHIAVVEPGVDLTMFQPIDRAEARRNIGYGPGRLLLFVGRLERLKGVEVAIRALAFLQGQQPEARLLVLGEDASNGDESEMERLKAIASSLGVRDRVDFLGSVAHHELPYFYSAADVCVMPSYSESFGLVALEAQACGLPVVGFAASGLRSVVRDGVSGYLLETHDAETYANRIGRLLAEPSVAEEMGRHGRQLAQKFSWTRTADRLQDLFEHVIENTQVRVQTNALHE